MDDVNRYEFVVQGNPIAQPRHRHSQASFGRKARSYIDDDHPVHAYKHQIKMTVLERFSGRALRGALRLGVEFVLPRMKHVKSSDRVPHTSTPDLDNLQKSLMDSLNGLLWKDDSQVASIEAKKWVSAEGERPHTRFWVEPMPEISQPTLFSR